MNEIKEIGGYFNLELPAQKGFLHDDGVLLNSGRNALEYVLRVLRDVRRVWIPYYTCEVVVEPLVKLGLTFSFYHIDCKLELKEPIRLQEDEYLLYTNYFGIKDEYVKVLAKQYGSKLIVDNAQAWFSEPIEGLSTIYSPRKFVGVPDGGVAFCPNEMDVNQFEQDSSFDRCSHLLKRLDLGAMEGYSDFKENSYKLCNQPIRRMSNLTKALLSSINFDEVRIKRIDDFKILHNTLKYTNKFKIPEMSSFVCPMVYPYLTKDGLLKQKLIENKVFVATYWPNVRGWVKEGLLEKDLTENLVPIPCDQRLGVNDINRVLSLIES